MKIANPDGPPGRRPRRSTAQSQRATPSLILGIPQEEFTPRAREATMALLREVEQLRRQIEQTRARLEDMARTADQDTLLPILNRRALVREISRFIGFADRYGTPSSLLYFDLDNFKAVNDQHGHAAGDVVLRHFCDLIASQIRESDVLARVGGDEFAVILAHITPDQAQNKGTAIAQSLREKPPLLNGTVVELRFSCGACELRAEQTVEEALAAADQAMYAEKRRRATLTR
jgi:diguanylate cyclase (GGDEF)-like protein